MNVTLKTSNKFFILYDFDILFNIDKPNPKHKITLVDENQICKQNKTIK